VDATRKSMREITGALVGIATVLGRSLRAYGGSSQAQPVSFTVSFAVTIVSAMLLFGSWWR